jgi:hypothetical protein
MMVMKGDLKLKKYVIVTALLLPILILAMGWLYPFSTFSMQDSFTYEPTTTSLEYAELSTKLERKLASEGDKSTLKRLLSSTINTLDVNWMKETGITEVQLDELYQMDSLLLAEMNALKAVSRNQDGFNHSSRMALHELIKSLNLARETLQPLINDSFQSRFTIKDQAANLTESYFHSLKKVERFIEEY